MTLFLYQNSISSNELKLSQDNLGDINVIENIEPATDSTKGTGLAENEAKKEIKEELRI